MKIQTFKIVKKKDYYMEISNSFNNGAVDMMVLKIKPIHCLNSLRYDIWNELGIEVIK